MRFEKPNALNKAIAHFVCRDRFDDRAGLTIDHPLVIGDEITKRNPVQEFKVYAAAREQSAPDTFDFVPAARHDTLSRQRDADGVLRIMLRETCGVARDIGADLGIDHRSRRRAVCINHEGM